MHLPKLFHIGTQKAGSTYLYNLLSGHPEVTLSGEKEVCYFSRDYDKGINYYASKFSGSKNIIDISPNYFVKGEVVATRIKKYADKYLSESPKFLLILRNPIDYIFSFFQMHLKYGYFERRPDEYRVIPDNIIDFVLSNPSYLDRGFYSKILKNFWFNNFHNDQFKIILFEDFIKDTQPALREIQNFWGLPIRDLRAGTVSKNKMLKYKCLFKMRIYLSGSHFLKNKLKYNKFFNYVYDRFLTVNSRSEISEEERNFLKGFYKKDVDELKKVCDNNFSCWNDFQ